VHRHLWRDGLQVQHGARVVGLTIHKHADASRRVVVSSTRQPKRPCEASRAAGRLSHRTDSRTVALQGVPSAIDDRFVPCVAN